MKNKIEDKCKKCKLSYFERNNYYYGKLMTVRDFFAEQCYFNEKRWLINRMVNGWGVVCGLDVKPKEGSPDMVIVTPGMAIDSCGREILVCHEQEVHLIPKESPCQQVPPGNLEEDDKKLAICLEYYECMTEAVHLPPVACDQKEKCEFNRIRDSFKIRVIPISNKAPVHPPFCLEKEEKKISLYQYLCDRLREHCPEPPDCPCVILATVKVDQNGKVAEEDIDVCSRRKLVYNNPLLYELIHCFHGDLPHVIGMNWEDNDAKLAWDTFANEEGFIYNEGLQIFFDLKMNPDTINDHTFLFWVKRGDPDTGNYHYEQIPPEQVSYTYNNETKESVAKFVVSEKWHAETYLGYSRILDKRIGEFMVVLKGDFILSAEEDGRPIRALDGNFIGGKLPSGNGTQGGDFISWFSVEESGQER
jgi:hypothetical protein